MKLSKKKISKIMKQKNQSRKKLLAFATMNQKLLMLIIQN